MWLETPFLNSLRLKVVPANTSCSNGSLVVGAGSSWRVTGRGPQGRSLSDLLSDDGLLHGDLLGELLQGVLTLQLLQLSGGVLVQELVNGEVSTSNTDVDLVLVDTDPYPLGSELVDTLVLSHKHDLELLSLRVVVNKLSKALVDGVVLNWDVDSNTLLQLNDVVLKSLNLNLSVLQLSEEFETSLVSLVDLVLHF